MKRLIIGIILSALSSIYSISQAQVSSFMELKTLYKSSGYFKLYSKFQSDKSNLTDWQRLYFDALLKSLYNKPEDSNKDINILLESFTSFLDDTLRHELFKTRLINCINLFDYGSALRTTEYIMNNFPALTDSAEKNNYLNSLEIWRAAKDLKHKNTEIRENTKVKIRRDMAGYVNIPLKINGIEVEFIFDTGANISTVTRSYAKKLKLKPLEGVIDVGTSTDEKVTAALAYADSVNIGKITCYNVLFLVVEDEILSFAGGLYVIDGIAGLPIIKELKELRISSDVLFVPAVPVKKELKNFVLEGFNPIINAVYNNDTLELFFDSGAKKTSLYYSFFQKYKSEIVRKFEREEITVEGAAGEMKYKGYILDEVIFNIAGTKAVLEDVKLIAEPFKDKCKGSFGSLGQDYIKQFKTMIINFDSMYLEFVK